MWIRRFAVLILLLLTSPFTVRCYAQTPTSIAPTTAGAVLSGASHAFSNGVPVHGVTLKGTANWIAGSDNENGSVTLVANADGSYQITLELAQSSRTETQTAFAQGQQCMWSGSDGVAHVASAHNCLLPVAWFLPEVALFGNQQPPSVATILMGNSTDAQNPGVDIRQQQSIAPEYVSADMTTLYTHLTAVDIYYAPATYLPVSLFYATHPDANAATDIPVRVEFSNYQTVGGITVPFRIQRYVNGVLALDITISAVTWS